jgi:hypothetical protein
MPSDGIILFIVFILSALFELFDRLVGEFKLPKKKKVLNIVAICMAFAIVMGAVIFILLHYSIAFSVIAVVCACAYFIEKLIRLGRIFNTYLLG